MNIKILAQSIDYKKVFNCIYKNYIKGNRQYDKDSIIKLDLYFRQLHSNFKKENNSKDALNGLVNKVSNQNCRNIKQWTEEHPGYQVFDSPENMDYVRLTQAVLGGLGEQECKQFKDKIIRSVIKEVMVNKI